MRLRVMHPENGLACKLCAPAPDGTPAKCNSSAGGSARAPGGDKKGKGFAELGAPAPGRDTEGQYTEAQRLSNMYLPTSNPQTAE